MRFLSFKNDTEHELGENPIPGGAMKVYRGRPRGHNQSYEPHVVWTGGMVDTKAIEDWVLQLASQPSIE